MGMPPHGVVDCVHSSNGAYFSSVREVLPLALTSHKRTVLSAEPDASNEPSPLHNFHTSHFMKPNCRER
jgi:hypothetical protein